MKRFSFFVTVFLATRIFSNLIHYPYFRRLRPYFILCFYQLVPNSWSSRISSTVKLVWVLFLRPTFKHQRIRPYFVGGSPFEQFLEFYVNIRKHNIMFFWLLSIFHEVIRQAGGDFETTYDQNGHHKCWRKVNNHHIVGVHGWLEAHLENCELDL